MHRFYCPSLDQNSKTITIHNPQEIHHLKDVLRLKKGERVTIFNGRGGEALGKISALTSNQVSLSVTSFRDKISDQPRLILACAIPKRSKFELIIEKATELGVDEIVPLQTKRTEVRYAEDKQRAKQKRFAAVALAASKQCQRSILPIVHPVTSLPEALKLVDEQTIALIPWLEGLRTEILQALTDRPSFSRIIIFIGPEGDFTSQEIDRAVKAGCLPTSLGPTVLRVETAAITGVSIIRQYCIWRSGGHDAKA